MKYFLDTEFIEGFTRPNFIERVFFGRKPEHYIQLISIGIVCENGDTYYAISKEYDYNRASDWVKTNVIMPMYTSQEIRGFKRQFLTASNFHKHIGKSISTIASEIKEFVYWEGTQVVSEQTRKTNPEAFIEPRFYGYYADYDWVVFCSMFGKMIDLPKGFPMYCRDLKQMMDERGLSKEAVPDPQGEHNALVDAQWNKMVYNALMQGDFRNKIKNENA